MKKALIIIDMLNDFLDGVLGNPLAEGIISPTQQMLAHARQSDDWVVVFSNDCHDPTDREMKIWGAHAMKGTRGAEVIDALRPELKANKEWLEPKHYYGAFDGTDLASRLRELGVEKVYLAGQHTHCCVRHSAYGAFLEGFEIGVLKDCVVAFGDVDNEGALDYLKTIYGAELISQPELCASNYAKS